MKQPAKVSISNARPRRQHDAAAGDNSSAEPKQSSPPPAPPREPLVFATFTRVPQPDGALLFRPGKVIDLGTDDEVSTAEAARIIGVGPRRVQALCDEGILVEGADWRRPGARGRYKIKRTSAERFAGRRQEATGR